MHLRFSWNDESLIRKMADRIVAVRTRRVFCTDGMSLGFRRLSIIDLSENGSQPMFNETTPSALVFNGEIYNFQELRPELEARAPLPQQHRFEVILHGYEEYGIDVVNHLRGMFGFALYDTVRKLLLARDRIGIKPLYYTRQNGRLVFGSEIKSILQDPGVERQVNHQALYDYLGFEFVPHRKPCSRASASYPPATCSSGRTAGLVPPLLGPELPAGRAHAPLRGGGGAAACAPGHRGEEPPGLGCSARRVLSGGLDSSCLVALMRRHISGRSRPSPSATRTRPSPSSTTPRSSPTTARPTTGCCTGLAQARLRGRDPLPPGRAHDRPEHGAALPALHGSSTSPSACPARARTRASPATTGSRPAG